MPFHSDETMGASNYHIHLFQRQQARKLRGGGIFHTILRVMQALNLRSGGKERNRNKLVRTNRQKEGFKCRDASMNSEIER